MRKFQRTATPKFLEVYGDEWGRAWERRRQGEQGATFRWGDLHGEPVNKMLLPPLKAQTQDHCSYCDNYPIAPPAEDTIDHFRPKSKFPLEAFLWCNLYFSCPWCQRQKGASFIEEALRPDSFEYSFSRFFRWDYTTGEILVNELATPEDQSRARATIRLFGLNNSHPKLRMRSLRNRIKAPNDSIDDSAYRDFVSEPAAA